MFAYIMLSEKQSVESLFKTTSSLVSILGFTFPLLACLIIYAILIFPDPIKIRTIWNKNKRQRATVEHKYGMPRVEVEFYLIEVTSQEEKVMEKGKTKLQGPIQSRYQTTTFIVYFGRIIAPILIPSWIRGSPTLASPTTASYLEKIKYKTSAIFFSTHILQ